MNKLSLDKGRINQKQNTRTSILLAAKTLMKKKKKISLEDIAREADISRATIYRYFTNIDILLIESSLDIHFDSPVQIAEKLQGQKLSDRLVYIQSYYNNSAQEHELLFRGYLSAVLKESIHSNKKIRGARRVATLNKSLQDYKSRMSAKDYKNLINIASILMGIDPLIVAKDVCRLDNKATNELLEWALLKILHGIEIEGA